MTEEETKLFSRSKNSTLNRKNKRGFNIKYLPRVFTEQEVAMLATVLKSETATRVSIRIMDIFVAMRKYISDDLLIQRHYNEMTIKHDSEIKLLKESFDKLQEKKTFNDIYFNGQIYDAYSKILDIFNECNKELIIIDSYADKTLLDIIKNLKVKVIIITKPKGLLKEMDIENYNKQYNNLKIIYNDTFHDRYFILDRKKVYHCGTSINRIGKRTFSVNYISDDQMINSLVNIIEKLIEVK